MQIVFIFIMLFLALPWSLSWIMFIFNGYLEESVKEALYEEEMNVTFFFFSGIVKL